MKSHKYAQFKKQQGQMSPRAFEKLLEDADNTVGGSRAQTPIGGRSASAGGTPGSRRDWRQAAGNRLQAAGSQRLLGDAKKPALGQFKTGGGGGGGAAPQNKSGSTSVPDPAGPYSQSRNLRGLDGLVRTMEREDAEQVIAALISDTNSSRTASKVAGGAPAGAVRDNDAPAKVRVDAELDMARWDQGEHRSRVRVLR
jgi:hypothetical protein